MGERIAHTDAYQMGNVIEEESAAGDFRPEQGKTLSRDEALLQLADLQGRIKDSALADFIARAKEVLQNAQGEVLKPETGAFFAAKHIGDIAAVLRRQAHQEKDATRKGDILRALMIVGMP